jgi:diguanylate cyclase (GGDEF)-like protein
MGYGGVEDDEEAVAAAAERIRAMIEAAAFVFSGKTIPITASLGVAAHVAGQTSNQLIAAADAALYEAKRGGRNRVVVK